MSKEKKDVHIFVSPEEKEIIENKAEALGMSVSAYMKYLALNDSINLEVKINDLTDYTAEIYELNKKIQGILNTLNRTGNVYPQDIAKIKEYLEEINNVNKKTLTNIYDNRQQEYRDLKREIRKQYKKMLKNKPSE